jgi:hypothetical protein
MRDGFNRREDREWEKIATLGIWILAPHTKKKLTVLELLGRRSLVTLPKPPATDEDEEPDVDLIEAEKAAVLARALAWAQE